MIEEIPAADPALPPTPAGVLAPAPYPSAPDPTRSHGAMRIQQLEDMRLQQMRLTDNLTARVASVVNELAPNRAVMGQDDSNVKSRSREPKPTSPPMFIGRGDKLGYPTWEFQMSSYLRNYLLLKKRKCYRGWVLDRPCIDLVHAL